MQSKRATIHQSEMPLELLTNSRERPPPPVNKTPYIRVVDMDKIQKKPRVANLNNWHPKLKAALEGPLKEAENPTFTKIMEFFKKDAYGVIPKGSPICSTNYLFGSCFFKEKGTKKHIIAKYSQVQPILALVEDFVKDPRKINAGQSL